MTIELLIQFEMYPPQHKCITVKLYSNTIVIFDATIERLSTELLKTKGLMTEQLTTKRLLDCD